VLWLRVVVAAALAVLLAVVIVASTRTTPIAVGGDCGGKSCVMDRDHDHLVIVGLAVGVVLLVVAAWPVLVRRYRNVWGDQRYPFGTWR